jgi:circadian clock protein KaiB
MTEHNAKQDDDSMGASMDDATAAFEKALADESHANYVFTLYVAGARSRSQRAIENIQRLCEEHLAGRYELQIVDIYQQPALAQVAQIIAAPTLVKKMPPPLQRLIGDLTHDGSLLVSLGIKVPEEPEQPPMKSPRDSP